MALVHVLTECGVALNNGGNDDDDYNDNGVRVSWMT